MKQYNITIPAFTRVVVARTKKEAVELFWFDYDYAQQDHEWNRPLIKEITN